MSEFGVVSEHEKKCKAAQGVRAEHDPHIPAPAHHDQPKKNPAKQPGMKEPPRWRLREDPTAKQSNRGPLSATLALFSTNVLNEHGCKQALVGAEAKETRG